MRPSVSRPVLGDQVVGRLNFLGSLGGQLDHVLRHALAHHLVGVILAHQLSVGLLDLGIARARVNPQGLVGRGKLRVALAAGLRAPRAVVPKVALGADHANKLVEQRSG